MNKLIIFCILCVVSVQSTYADKVSAPLFVGHAGEDAHYGKFFGQVIRLALEKTKEEYGPYYVKTSPQSRTFHYLLYKFKWNDPNLTVVWLPATPERESDFQAVPFNLLKGLNHYRFLLARKDQRSKFAGIENVGELRALVAGSGTHWSDSKVMEYNKLPIIKSISAQLLPMLRAGRFDYFTRGAYEVFDESPHYGDALGLVPNLVLKYPTNYYFFVRKDDNPLAERLLAGLKKMEQDGSFDALFFAIPGFKKGWDDVHNNPELKTIELKSLPSVIVNTSFSRLSE